MYSEALVKTDHASRYLQQLCKHWSHKLPTKFDKLNGEIELPMGNCNLNATDDTLVISVQADEEKDVAKLEEVLASHLLRFAFREDLKVVWQRGD